MQSEGLQECALPNSPKAPTPAQPLASPPCRLRTPALGRFALVPARIAASRPPAAFFRRCSTAAAMAEQPKVKLTSSDAQVGRGRIGSALWQITACGAHGRGHHARGSLPDRTRE
jgi:hypothetical protein